jgi:lysyl-tRNA synthetase class 2
MRRDSRRARLIGLLTGLGGIIVIVSTLPMVNQRFGRFTDAITPFGVRVTSHVISVAAGVALLYLAGQLARRRHLAWILAISLFTASFVVARLREHHYIAAGYSLFMVILLAISRSKFRAPGDPPTLVELLRFIPRYFLIVFVYGYAALYLERKSVSPTPTFWNNTKSIVLGLFGLDGPYEYQRRFFEWAFPSSLLMLGLGGLAFGIFLLFRPIIAKPSVTDATLHEAVDIVRSHSNDSLDYFALRDDKLFFISSDHRALIAYTYVARYALVSGDPIGDPDSIPLVVDEFLAMCRDRAWGVSFLAVREADRKMYTDHGLHTVYLGDEAVVDVRGFTLTGKKWKSIRQSAGRIERTYRFMWMAETDASPALIAELNHISEKWRGKAPERGFTMTLSQDVEGTNPEFRLCIAIDEDGHPGGFLRVVPIYGDRPGYTLDLMRRDPDTPNGMSEFLLTRTIMKIDELGMQRLSMNFAAWGRFFEDDVDYSFTQRIVKLILNILSPFYQIKSLKEFNQRFYPEWVPRCIAYEGFRTLPRVALLYSAAEGFLNLPVIGKYLLPRTVVDPGHPVVDPIADSNDRVGD